MVALPLHHDEESIFHDSVEKYRENYVCLLQYTNIIKIGIKFLFYNV